MGHIRLKQIGLMIGAAIGIVVVIAIYYAITSILPHDFTTTLTGYQTSSTSGFYAAGGQAAR